MNTLLGLVMTLIIAAQSPNIPPELRVQALSVASIAIQYVQTHPETPSLQGIATISEPVIPELSYYEKIKIVEADAKIARIAFLKEHIAIYQQQIEDIEAKLAQVNADYEKLGTGATSLDTSEWNTELQKLNGLRVPLVRAQAPLMVELDSLQ